MVVASLRGTLSFDERCDKKIRSGRKKIKRPLVKKVSLFFPAQGKEYLFTALSLETLQKFLGSASQVVRALCGQGRFLSF